MGNQEESQILQDIREGFQSIKEAQKSKSKWTVERIIIIVQFIVFMIAYIVAPWNNLTHKIETVDNRVWTTEVIIWKWATQDERGWLNNPNSTRSDKNVVFTIPPDLKYPLYKNFNCGVTENKLE